jgi:hypothetical protein
VLRRVRAVNDVLYSVGNLFQGASARVIRLPGPRPSDACAASSVPIRRWSRFFTSTPARFVLTGGENERAAVDLLLHGALGFCTVVHRPQSSSASRRTLFDLGAHSRQEKAPGVMTKVLYVEDNEDNVYMLKMLLELLGDFEILTAERRRRPEAKLDETIEATLVDPSDDPALAMERKSQGEMLRRALADLSSDHREITDLVY